jgi:hypothetical protein
MFWRRLRASTPRCKEQFVVWIALTLLIASWLYPPWEHYNPHTRGVKADIGGVFKPWAPSPPHRQGVSAQHPHGWYFIFDTKQTETNTDELVMRVDFGRLMLLDGVIVAVAGGVLFTIRQSKSAQP